MSGFGSCSKEASLRSCCLRGFVMRYCGMAVPHMERCSPACLCYRSSPCRCTTPPLSSSGLAWRGLLLAAVLWFVSCLAIAEIHYSRGWPPSPIDQSLRDLKAAQGAYPYLPRFREGMAMRLKIFGEQGI